MVTMLHATIMSTVKKREKNLRRILFNKLKERIPGVSITTDIIVGFPNETDEDFEETLKIYNEFKYDLAYTFIYSPRDGTPAAKMEDNTPMDEKKERLSRLNDLINKYALESRPTQMISLF